MQEDGDSAGGFKGFMLSQRRLWESHVARVEAVRSPDPESADSMVARAVQGVHRDAFLRDYMVHKL